MYISQYWYDIPKILEAFLRFHNDPWGLHIPMALCFSRQRLPEWMSPGASLSFTCPEKNIFIYCLERICSWLVVEPYPSYPSEK